MVTLNALKNPRVIAFGIGPVSLMAILLTLVSSGGYPFFSLEALLALAIVILLGAILGLIIVACPMVLRIVVYSCLIAMTANAMLRPFPELEWLLTSGSRYSTAIFCASLVLLTIVRRKSGEILFVVFSALLVSSFIISSRPSGWTYDIRDTVINQDAALPPFIHIVLDAHIGLDGIPEETDPDGRFRMSILESYSDLGYKVFGNVHVFRPPQTILSFRNFLGFLHERDDDDLNRLPVQTKNVLGGPNRVFSSLDSLGYSINVIQSSHLNLCYSPRMDFHIQTCTTYPFGPFFDNLYGSSLGATQRAIVMVNIVFERAGIVTFVDTFAKSGLGKTLHFPKWPIIACINCVSAFTALQEFNDSIPKIKRGDAYFIHLMAPHAPYQHYNENCDMVFPFKVETSSATRNLVRYLGQANCTQEVLRETLVALSSHDATQDAIIIIHSDHGPEAPSLSVPNVRYDANSDSLGQVAYSTFFAVRAPDIGPEYDSNHYYLSVLLENVFNSQVVSKYAQ